MNDEAFTGLNLRSFAWSEFFQIMAAKTPKNPYRLQIVMFKLFYKGKKTKIWIEKPKVTYSAALEMAFLAAKGKKSTIERFATGRFWPCTWKISLSVRTKLLTENFVYWKLRTLFGFVSFQHIFHLKPYRQRSLRFLFRDWRFFYFHSLIKLTFLFKKELLC